MNSDPVSAAAQSSAQQAVDAVMKVADAQASATGAGGQVVNLGFEFWDDHLAVRVEMKNGEVHARFTTSSSELREAVATQWSSMTSGNDSQGQRSLHFAHPEFVSTESGGNSGNSGASFSFQGGHSGADEFGGSAFSGRAVSSAPVATPSPTASEPASSDRAGHLHAFA